jgi:hypothetical protein
VFPNPCAIDQTSCVERFHHLRHGHAIELAQPRHVTLIHGVGLFGDRWRSLSSSARVFTSSHAMYVYIQSPLFERAPALGLARVRMTQSCETQDDRNELLSRASSQNVAPGTNETISATPTQRGPSSLAARAK